MTKSLAPRKQTLAALAAALVFAISTTLPALATPYVFTNIADTSGPLASFSGPSVNDSGTVAFAATRDAGGKAIDVASAGHAPTSIASVPGYSPTQDINAAGTVAYIQFSGSTYSAMTASSTTAPHTLYTSSSAISSIAINDAGLAAFELSEGNGYLVTGTGGTPTTIASGTPPFYQVYSQTFGADIRTGGDVAFRATSSSFQDGIWTNAGGTVHALVDSSGTFANFSTPAINASGLISFEATSDDNTNGLYTIDLTGHLTTIVSSKSQAYTLGASINDLGHLAFYVHNSDGSSGIYTGPDPVANKVLATSDHLFGLSVTNVAAYDHALNNVDQITLRASLSDGNSYVLLATPAQPGDATLDGTVDLNDLNTVLNHLGQTSTNWTDGNFDNAATIDLNDLNAVLNHLGTTYTHTASALTAEPLLAPATPTPEPTSLALLTLGVWSTTFRRARRPRH